MRSVNRVLLKAACLIIFHKTHIMKRTTIAIVGKQKDNLLSKTISVLIKMTRFIFRRSTMVEVICALLIILFIYTGVNKLMDIDKFRLEIGRSPFIQKLAPFIAYALPVGEMMLSLALIIKRTRLIGLYLSFSLMALFTGYIWLMLNYAHDLPCSCGGIISKLSWEEHLVFNAVFTGLAMIGVLLQTKIIRDNKDKMSL
jgi:uncharacterized membrane protein YphA (DoxX/SURF4 family)